MFDTKEFYKLEQRSLIKICGKDKFSFLQGIISNDIENLKKKKCNLFFDPLATGEIYI